MCSEHYDVCTSHTYDVCTSHTLGCKLYAVGICMDTLERRAPASTYAARMFASFLGFDTYVKSFQE